MDKFNQLPLQKKVVVVIAGMAIFAGLVWYALISPVEEEMATIAQDKKRFITEINTLRTYVNKSNVKDRVAARKALESDKKEFEELLPPKEKLAEFITEISGIASEAGLNLQDIKPGKSGQRDYYLEIPIQVKVKGSYRKLLGFMQELIDRSERRDKGGRVVNLRNVSVVRVPLNVAERVNEIQNSRGDAKIANQSQQTKIDTLRVYDDLLSGTHNVELEASFDAYVFTYTGEKASEAAKKKSEALKKQIGERRKKRLKVGSYERSG